MDSGGPDGGGGWRSLRCGGSLEFTRPLAKSQADHPGDFVGGQGFVANHVGAPCLKWKGRLPLGGAHSLDGRG